MIQYFCTPETKPFLEMYAEQMEQLAGETREHRVLDTLFGLIYAEDVPDASEGDPYNIFYNKPEMLEILEGQNYAIFGNWILAYHFDNIESDYEEYMPIWM